MKKEETSPDARAKGSRRARYLAQRILLLAGLALLASGGGLILYTSGELPLLWALLPSLAVVGGILLSLSCYWKGWKSGWYFPGFMLLLCGAAALIIKTAEPDLQVARLWPFLVIFAGIALVPAGMGRKRRIKPGLFLISASFVLLGCFLLLFSLKVLRVGLRQFLGRFWPIFVIATGAVLLWIYAANKLKLSGGNGRPEGESEE